MCGLLGYQIVESMLSALVIFIDMMAEETGPHTDPCTACTEGATWLRDGRNHYFSMHVFDIIINAINTSVPHWGRLSATEVCGNQAFDLPEEAKEQFQNALAKWIFQRRLIVEDDMFLADDYPGPKEKQGAFHTIDQHRATVPFVVSMADVWPLGAGPPRGMKGGNMNIPFLAKTEEDVVFIGVRVPHGSNATPRHAATRICLSMRGY